MVYSGNAEPHVDELLRDPIARLVMRRDGLTEEMVRACIDDARRRLWAHQPAYEMARRRS